MAGKIPTTSTLAATETEKMCSLPTSCCRFSCCVVMPVSIPFMFIFASENCCVWFSGRVRTLRVNIDSCFILSMSVHTHTRTRTDLHHPYLWGSKYPRSVGSPHQYLPSCHSPRRSDSRLRPSEFPSCVSSRSTNASFCTPQRFLVGEPRPAPYF